MKAYYNDNDPRNAQWLRNLIDAGEIAPGDVDERSILEVRPEDLRGYIQCHFFAGIGVWSHALRLSNWPDSRPVWTGSCPCQPFSVAGRGLGHADERHLWPAFYNLIAQRRPPVVLGEQVASKDGLAWLDTVYADMEAADYAFAAADLCAAGFGAPHIRQRLYFVGLGEPEREGLEGHAGDGDDATRRTLSPRPAPEAGFWSDTDWVRCRDGKTRPVERGTSPVADGTPENMAALQAFGNAIVAPVAAGFVRSVMEAM